MGTVLESVIYWLIVRYVSVCGCCWARSNSSLVL